jgi:hypothetical protein
MIDNEQNIRNQLLHELLQSIKVAKVRKKLLQNLSDYGVEWNEDMQKLEVENLRFTQKKLSLVTNQNGKQYENKVKDYFANPNEINLYKVEPYLVEVQENNITNKIWAYCLSFWSVPVSVGYGRRIRFLVFDKQNHKVIGLFGLCDPLIGFNIRDEYVGWNREQKQERLYSCLTAYILGAVPPYNTILGSKLVALTTMFPEVRETFKQKYEGKTTIIAGKQKMPVLAMIDTFGAFEKSAIYTRLLNWQFLDYTQGKSHIHITANGSWELIKEFVPQERFASYKYGQGSNWKLRTLRVGLSNLGFPNEDILSIGWKRAYYMNPLLKNWKEFLTMQTDKPEFIDYSNNDLITYWKERWLIPRQDKLLEKLNNLECEKTKNGRQHCIGKSGAEVLI